MDEKILYDCPFCEEEHYVQLKREKGFANIKGEIIQYDKIVYYCDIEEEEFCPKKLMDNNLLEARDAYRSIKGLLTSKEIKGIREKYKLTQKEFSNLLGWGDITVQRYETKQIQDSTYDRVIRLCYNNATYCLEMLKSNKENFSDNRYAQILETIKNIIKQDGNEYCTMESIYNRYLDFEEESEYNGQKKLDIKKINSIIGYFANYVNPLYKVKLMKLLWYADSLYYKNFNKSMTGLVYQHLPLGAVPVACNEILNLPSIKVEEEYSNEYVMYRIYPNMQINISDFTLDEVAVLQKVASFFKDYRTKEIVEYMHNEKAYIETNPNQLISFDYARFLSINK